MTDTGRPMIDPEHHRRLERFYASAPVTQWYGTTLTVSDGGAEVRLEVRPDFLHAANAVHGSVYFRLLDDAAFFAVNSRVPEVFVLTASFNVHFVRPVASGRLLASGRVIKGGGRLFFAESDLVDGNGDLLGRGSGVFIRSSIPLDARVGYA